MDIKEFEEKLLELIDKASISGWYDRAAFDSIEGRLENKNRRDWKKEEARTIKTELLTAFEQLKAELQPKPCPFCGEKSDTLITNRNNTQIEYWIDCNSCSASGLIKSTRHEAIEAWNKIMRLDC